MLSHKKNDSFALITLIFFSSNCPFPLPIALVYFFPLIHLSSPLFSSPFSAFTISAQLEAISWQTDALCFRGMLRVCVCVNVCVCVFVCLCMLVGVLKEVVLLNHCQGQRVKWRRTGTEEVREETDLACRNVVPFLGHFVHTRFHFLCSASLPLTR